jgi:hypothetical protein
MLCYFSLGGLDSNYMPKYSADFTSMLYGTPQAIPGASPFLNAQTQNPGVLAQQQNSMMIKPDANSPMAMMNGMNTKLPGGRPNGNYTDGNSNDDSQDEKKQRRVSFLYFQSIKQSI